MYKDAGALMRSMISKESNMVIKQMVTTLNDELESREKAIELAAAEKAERAKLAAASGSSVVETSAGKESSDQGQDIAEVFDDNDGRAFATKERAQICDCCFHCKTCQELACLSCMVGDVTGRRFCSTLCVSQFLGPPRDS